jgi:hypothetical protein
MQDNLAFNARPFWYVNEDGTLNMKKLLREFQQFFRENSESWLERFDYKEAGFQLLLQAFLQRIVNGGGLIEREYALGRGRVDLLVRWRYPQNVNRSGQQAQQAQQEQRILLELKTIRKSTSSSKAVIQHGLEQTARYAERTNPTEAHLIVCDERAGRTWEEKIYNRLEECGIYIWGV